MGYTYHRLNHSDLKNNPHKWSIESFPEYFLLSPNYHQLAKYLIPLPWTRFSPNICWTDHDRTEKYVYTSFYIVRGSKLFTHFVTWDKKTHLFLYIWLSKTVESLFFKGKGKNRKQKWGKNIVWCVCFKVKDPEVLFLSSNSSKL